MDTVLAEQVLQSWVGLTGILKNNRLTKELTYNEATVLLFVYRTNSLDPVSMKTLLAETRMLKSLLNRTVDGLCAKGFLTKKHGEKDQRTIFVQLCPDKLQEFLSVHQRSLQLSQRVIGLIGQEDAEAFIRIYQKIQKGFQEENA